MSINSNFLLLFLQDKNIIYLGDKYVK